MGERSLRLLAKISQGSADRDTERLCDVCVEVTGTSGAGLVLMTADGPQGSVYTTDPVSARIEELQFALGEGPGVDAHNSGRPVLVPDLRAADEVRWPAFVVPALDAGVRAIFGFAVRIGEAQLGALDLYRDRPGPLDDEQHADALVLADLAARTVLALQAEAPPGRLALELEHGADLEYVVHQASGMVAAQLEVSVDQALVRLRAYAFGNDYTLRAVAAAVVDRRLRFDGGLTDATWTP